jgi:hypothetical protein
MAFSKLQGGFAHSEDEMAIKNGSTYIDQRRDELFVCEPYKLFFRTGQGALKRSIAVTPFKAFDGPSLDYKRSTAKPWTRQGEHLVSINVSNDHLSFCDNATGTISQIDITELDEDAQVVLKQISGLIPLIVPKLPGL